MSVVGLLVTVTQSLPAVLCSRISSGLIGASLQLLGRVVGPTVLGRYDEAAIGHSESWSGWES